LDGVKQAGALFSSAPPMLGAAQRDYKRILERALQSIYYL
jgi:hypothetical protein